MTAEAQSPSAHRASLPRCATHPPSASRASRKLLESLNVKIPSMSFSYCSETKTKQPAVFLGVSQDRREHVVPTVETGDVLLERTVFNHRDDLLGELGELDRDAGFEAKVGGQRAVREEPPAR